MNKILVMINYFSKVSHIYSSLIYISDSTFILVLNYLDLLSSILDRKIHIKKKNISQLSIISVKLNITGIFHRITSSGSK